MRYTRGTKVQLRGTTPHHGEEETKKKLQDRVEMRVRGILFFPGIINKKEPNSKKKKARSLSENKAVTPAKNADRRRKNSCPPK